MALFNTSYADPRALKPTRQHYARPAPSVARHDRVRHGIAAIAPSQSGGLLAFGPIHEQGALALFQHGSCGITGDEVLYAIERKGVRS